MIALDPFTTPGDTVWPQLGRGGFMRNANGAAVISHPDGGKRSLIYKGASAWWPFAEPYDGDPIYGERGTWVHTLCDLLDSGEEITVEFMDAGVELGISLGLQDHIVTTWQTFRTAHSITVHAIEQTFVNDRYKCASNADRIVSIGGGPWTVGDIKTSSNVMGKTIYAAQLAMGASGSKMYDAATGERTDWAQPIDATAGYIFWFPLNAAIKADGPDSWPDWSLIRVELDDIIWACNTLAAIRDVGPPDCFTTIEPAADAAADRMAALKARYGALSDGDRARFVALGVEMADADAVEAGLDSVDPFTAEAEPLPVIEIKANTVPELTATTDEGALLTDDQADTVRAHYARLTPNQTTYMAAIAKGAHKGGAGLDMKLHPATTRRGYLITSLSKFAAWAIADADDADAFAKIIAEADRNIHDAIDIAIGHGHDWGLHSTGTVVATMNVEQSQALYGLVNLAVADSLPLASSDWQRPAFAEVANQITPQAAA
jgi:hypothetical protein